ncbi:MAG: tRNA lysidine(34) synthetase TilS [Tissierellia bacterium]|nr:tRNA lysidine(34) synthetase TilS [Tissierellia bacterium]
MIKKKILSILKDDAVLSEGGKVLIGCSGGGDSIFLTEMLLQLREEIPLELLLVHLHHGLRKEADEEEAFVRSYAQKRGLELIVHRRDITQLAEKSRRGIEEEGRIQRYEIFFEEAKKREIDTICTAHHLDDDMETVLMNFARGAGLHGVAGLQWRKGKLFRPLLSTTKEEILTYLTSHGIAYCTDQSNFDSQYQRSRIRQEVLPVLEALDPQLYQHWKVYLSNMKRVRRMVEDWVDGFLDRFSTTDYGLEIPIPSMLEYFPRERAHLYMGIIDRLRGSREDVYSYHLQAIDDLLEAREEKWISFSDVRVIKSYDRLIFLKDDIQKPTAYHVDAKKEEAGYRVVAVVDAKAVTHQYTLRHRKSGDVIQYNGCNRKLTRIFMDKKIPKFLRKYLRVLESNQGIFFVEGVGVADWARPTADTKDILYIKEEQ